MSTLELLLVLGLDQYLRGRRSPLLDGPAQEYPEVRFSKRK
jgi:hypothetical protein